MGARPILWHDIVATCNLGFFVIFLVKILKNNYLIVDNFGHVFYSIIPKCLEDFDLVGDLLDLQRHLDDHASFDLEDMTELSRGQKFSELILCL